MKFFANRTEFIYEGQPLFSKNNLYFEPLHKCDEVISFGDWSLELNIDSERKTLVSLEGIFSKRDIIECKFDIPVTQNAEIYFDNKENFGKWKKYYDKEKEWFCFGSIDSIGTAYCFASNTIAIINQGELKALYVKPKFLEVEKTF